MSRLRLRIAAALLTLLLTAPTASALSGEEEPAGTGTPAILFSPDRVIVQWANGASKRERVDARESADVTSLGQLGDPAFQLVRTEPGLPVREALETLREDPNVLAATRDSYSTPHAVPNDPLFGQLWGLQNLGGGIGGITSAIFGADINAPLAWDQATGSSSVVIAVLDSGYRFNSPDLGPVAWTNPLDPPGGGDNDGNGIVDDSNGADFVGPSVNTPATDGDPTDDNLIDGGHGVHTAGTIGAAGNNGVGITGVSQNARLMPLRVCSRFTDPTPTPTDESGVLCPTSAQISAINYAGSHGARVANMSLGGTSFNQNLINAIAANSQTLFVIAAGNDGVNNETEHHYPCDYVPADANPDGTIDNIVCVAATTQADGLAGFSDWGAVSVDLGAPGTETLSTYPAMVTPIEDDFEVDDFSSSWETTGGTGFGRAAPGDGPLTTFGMNDSPGGAPLPSSVHVTTWAPNSPVPAGAGACTLSGLRFRRADTGSSFSYSVLSDGAPVFTNTGSTNTSGSSMATFNTTPISGLGGHSVKIRFSYTAGPSPTAESGIWFDDLDLTCYAPLSTPAGYAFLQGTSMAAPHVSGAAGLLFSLKPSATVTEVKNALLAGVDPIPQLAGKTTTGGRLNLVGAMHALVPLAGQPDTEITSGPPSAVQGSAAVFQFHRSDSSAAAAFECRLVAESGWSPCVSPKAYTVAPGLHVFQARANNGAQVDPIPASRSWLAEPATAEPAGTGSAAAPATSPPASTAGCKVPKLAGKILAQAKSALTTAGCTLGKVTKPKAKKGKKLPSLVVSSSTPDANASTAGAVDLKLGPKPKTKRKKHRR